MSFVDAQVGRVLDEVDRLGLNTNTVVVLWGDHGWHLGDHNLWGKHTKYERAVRSALIIRTPDMRFRGYATDALVESVDLYPTFAELCGLTNPPPPAALAGVSLAPILTDPRHPGKDGAITCWAPASSLRTDRHRLIYYHDNGVAELFDHASDPWEMTNVAQRAGNETVVSNLVAASLRNTPALRAAPDHYQDWVAGQFSPSDQAVSNVVGRLRDPDGDGRPNVEEYYHGSCPTSFTTVVGLEPVFPLVEGQRYFGVRFARNMDATDLRSGVRTCSSLSAPLWDFSAADDPRYRVSRAVTGKVEIITIRDVRPMAGQASRFARLELNWEE